MSVQSARKKRPLFYRLFILVLTTILIATDLLGTVPNSPFSAELRQYLALMLPAEFTGWLNQELTGYSLPTLPAALPGVTSESNNSGLPATLIPPTATSTLTLIPILTLTPTFTPTPTHTPTPTITPTPTLLPNPAGTWTFNWQYSDQFDTIWHDTFRIVQKGDNFLVTFISDPYLGDLEIRSQHWDGSSLDFTYYNWAISVTVHLKTIGIDSNGQLWVSVLSQWMGPPTTALPPAQ
ncbi:MAG TPA: hypothetical protein VFR47_19445 [Anaerolineales bacterium]|nr:hypothetical protein [Anaerolineales bacterium]